MSPLDAVLARYPIGITGPLPSDATAALALAQARVDAVAGLVAAYGSVAVADSLVACGYLSGPPLDATLGACVTAITAWLGSH